MSALVKAAGHPLGNVRQGPVKLVIGAAMAVTIAAGGFAVGRATSDLRAVAVNGGSLSTGAVHPEQRTILDQGTRPAPGSIRAIHGRHNHHPMAAPVSVFTLEQAAKDCQIHRLVNC